MSSNIEAYSDVIFYSLCACMLVVLGYCIQKGLRMRSQFKADADKGFISGTLLSATGILVTELGGLATDAFFKNASFYQQIRFLLYYSGLTLVLSGATHMIRMVRFEALNAGRLVQVIWALFLISLVVAGFYLFNPATFVLNEYHEQIQLVIYWIPMLTASFFAAGGLLIAAWKLPATFARKKFILVCSSALLLFVGLLREAGVLNLESLLANLLIAFIPFTLATFCLAWGLSVPGRS